MPAKRKHTKKAKKPCSCLACRMQDAILMECAPHDAIDSEPFQVNAYEALAAILPTMAMFFSSIDYMEVEDWFRTALTERTRIMLPDGVELGDSYKGRA